MPAAVLPRHDGGLRAGRDAVRAAAGARRPARTVAARAAFATALVSSLSAARTVKLAGATRPVLDHLARPGRASAATGSGGRSRIQVWARSTPSMVSGLLPIAAWALYLAVRLDLSLPSPFRPRGSNRR